MRRLLYHCATTAAKLPDLPTLPVQRAHLARLVVLHDELERPQEVFLEVEVLQLSLLQELQRELSGSQMCLINSCYDSFTIGEHTETLVKKLLGHWVSYGSF